jgi:diaminopimelate decarboxylase
MGIVHRVTGTSKRLLKKGLRMMFAASGSTARASLPEHWGLTGGTSAGLALDGIPLHTLGEEFGFPVHIVNAARLRDNARRFLALPHGHDTGCEVFYSYKTNPVPGVLRELHAQGLGAEVISHYELWLALQLGVPPAKIVLNGPAKSDAALQMAIAAGIQLLNFNHREEIAVVSRIAASMQRKPRVGLRVTVGGAWAGQFGVPVEGGRALAAFEEALASPHLDVVGLHAHRGGMIRSEGELTQFVDAVLAFTDQLHQRRGLSLDVLNFGGSLAAPTVHALSTRDVRLNRAFHRDLPPANPAAALTIDRYIATLVQRVDEFHRTRGRRPPRIFIEPGRAVTADAQMLLASVIAVKEEGDASFAILNAGINLAESCRSEYHQMFSVNRATLLAEKVYTVVGPICTPGDTLYWAVRLPRLVPGDSVVIMDAGAYFVPFSTAFSFPRPPVLMVDGGRARVLRRGETFDDLVEYDRVVPAR